MKTMIPNLTVMSGNNTESRRKIKKERNAAKQAVYYGYSDAFFFTKLRLSAFNSFPISFFDILLFFFFLQTYEDI